MDIDYKWKVYSFDITNLDIVSSFFLMFFQSEIAIIICLDLWHVKRGYVDGYVR